MMKQLSIHQHSTSQRKNSKSDDYETKTKSDEDKSSEDENSRSNTLGFADEVKINNIRAFIYGWDTLILYDEPVIVDGDTFIAVTHCLELEANHEYLLDKG